MYAFYDFWADVAEAFAELCDDMADLFDDLAGWVRS